MKIKVYQSETASYIEMEVIGRLRYVGKSFGVDGLTNNKVYYVTGIEDGMFRIVDDSEEDYLYSITKPAFLLDTSLCGKWEVVEDNENKWLEKLLNNKKIQILYADNKVQSIEYIK